MTASRNLAALAAVALGLAGGWAYASDPNTVAADPPAFRAPEDPSDARLEQPAEPTGALSLDDALTLALMGNPELQAVSWQARAGEARVLQAGKIPNPELDVRAYQLVRPEAPDESPARNRRDSIPAAPPARHPDAPTRRRWCSNRR